MAEDTMNRTDKILYHIKKTSPGIEIGPSHNPIAPKRAGYKTHVIDHIDREHLIEKYRDHHVRLDAIEEVDFVWRGESYAELTGKRHFYDWIIASHVVEHTPDLITFLQNCDQVLQATGVLSLAIPDKRYCFDRYRPVTGLSTVVDSYLHKNTRHTPGTIAEYYLNVVAQNGNITWDAQTNQPFTLIHSLADARAKMQQAIDTDEYLDAHAWCFTPHSFRLLIHDLYTLGLIPFKEVTFFPRTGCEFYITLGRTGAGLPIDRIDMLQMIEAELHEALPLDVRVSAIVGRPTALSGEQKRY